jgi:hypothetical protein
MLPAAAVAVGMPITPEPGLPAELAVSPEVAVQVVELLPLLVEPAASAVQDA